jgi:tetratricopeptide (TPR) repeat protein
LRQALELERQAVNKQPTRPELAQEAALVYAQLANLYLADPSRRKDSRRARLFIQKALKLKPNDTAHLTTLGAVYCRLGQWDEAMATFQRVAEIEGTTTGSLKDWTGDNTPLTRIAQLNRQVAGVLRWFYLALCYQHQGETKKARECYRQALGAWQARRQELAPRVKELQALQTETAAALGVSDPGPHPARPAGLRR